MDGPDWVIGNHIPWDVKELEVWLGSDKIRSAKRDWGGAIVFTDCTHPAQNIFCDLEKVMGWRPLGAESDHGNP